MQELVNTEVDYIRSLEYVVDNYIPEMNRTSLPQPLRGKKNVVFANLEKIYEFHNETFIRLLQQCMNSPFQLGSCILQHVSLVLFSLQFYDANIRSVKLENFLNFKFYLYLFYLCNTVQYKNIQR